MSPILAITVINRFRHREMVPTEIGTGVHLIEVTITIAKILIILVKHLTREGLEILVPTTHIIKMHQMPVMLTKLLNSKIPTKMVLKTHSNREILLDLEQVASFVEK